MLKTQRLTHCVLFWLDSGIGAEIALQLARRGANIVVNFINESSRKRAEEVLKQVESHGVKGVLCQCDVGNIHEVPKLVKAALDLSQSGGVEIVIHKYVLPESCPMKALGPSYVMYRLADDVVLLALLWARTPPLTRSQKPCI